MYIWIIVIGVMVASFIVQKVLQSKFDKYSLVKTPNGHSGAVVARAMLQEYGINDVQVSSIPGKLTDHYDPRSRIVNLSEEVFEGRTIAAAAVAAHECGHAIQHATGYAPLKLRSVLVPVVTFANSTVQWVLLIGAALINITRVPLWIGIILFGATTLFSLITLPVEINASRRAVEWLSKSKTVDPGTIPLAADALKWAAYTYVIAAVGSVATLIYYIARVRK